LKGGFSMRKYFPMVFLVVAMVTMMAGCAVQKLPMGTPEAITPVDLNAKVRAGQLVRKVDNFLVIFDASSSMGEVYKGERKLDRALRIARGLNQTLPEVPLMGGLRIFGRRAFLSLESTTLLYGMTSYSTSGFEKGLQSIKYGRGYSPMELAINAAGLDLAPTRGNISLIIISDGEDMGNGPYIAAKHLAAGLGNRLCIYTIQIGDAQDGKGLLERMAKASGCGFGVNGDQILSGEGMGEFVESAFFEKRAVAVRMDSDGDGVYDDMDQCSNTPKGVQVDAKGCPFDSDGDGVYDYKDTCPKTPKGATVNDRGCWILKGLSFDTAKWDIKPHEYPILDNVVRILRQNASIKLEIQGHTDNKGAAGYNRKLSEKRARAVVEYLVKKGISSDRLTAAGYGFSRPAATNTTVAGRAMNRRVELKPIY
jgi:OOP family OmpA-OmpF porin